MNNQWHNTTEPQVLAFFDVNFDIGLTEADVLARLKKFGNNSDSSIVPDLQKIIMSTVIRNGKKQQVKSIHLVPGDIVVFSAGDRVPADIRLLRVEGLVTDQTDITGESAVYKNTFCVESTDISKQACMVFCGSYIVEGSGMGVVVARGNDTAIAKQKKRHKPRRRLANTLLTRRLRRLGIIAQDSKVLHAYKDISLVFIEAACTDEVIIDVIRKVQLTQRIPCKFIVSRHQAKRLSTELRATTWDIDAETNTSTTHILTQLDTSQFIVGRNQAAFVKIASVVRKKKTIFLWITDGLQSHPAVYLADISLLVGAKSRGDVQTRCSLIAPKAGAGIVTRILYNNK